MKILVTGVSGFLGKRVLNRIINQYGADSIVALSSYNVQGVQTVLHNDYSFGKDSLASIINTDYILLHLGAVTPKMKEDYSKVNFFMDNIRTTRYLLSHLPYCPNRIIYASSIDVYDRSTNTVIDEKSRIQASSAYGLSKYISEMLVKEYCENNSVPYSIGRIGNIYGPGEFQYSKIVGSFIAKCIKGDDIILYAGGKSIRNLYYIDDLCESLIYLMNTRDNVTVNLVSEKEYTTKAIAEIAVNVTSSSSKIILDDNGICRNDVFDASKRKTVCPMIETDLITGIYNTFLDYCNN